MRELLFKDEVYAITGAMFDVYKTLGIGFLEPVYQEALSVELLKRSVPFEREKPLTLFYKDVRLEEMCSGFRLFWPNNSRAKGIAKANKYRDCTAFELPEDHKNKARHTCEFWRVSKVGVETLCALDL